MPRLISMAYTVNAIREARKTVTRRKGWKLAKRGDLLVAVEKAQGLGKGGSVHRLALLQVEDVRREPLDRMTSDLDYGFEEIEKEGLAESVRWPSVFVETFASMNGVKPSDEVTRIRFRYVAAWPRCPDCGEFLCVVHGATHASECRCPEIDSPWWGSWDPYAGGLTIEMEEAGS